MEYVPRPLNTKLEEETNRIILEEPSFLQQQQSSSQIIQGVQGGLKPEVTVVATVLIEAKAKTTVVEVANEVPKEQTLEVQVLIEEESGGKGVAQVVDKGKKIIAQTQVSKSPASPTINAKEVGQSSPPISINTPLNPSFF